MKKHIVKFKNGSYGIRKGNKLFGYKFLDTCHMEWVRFSRDNNRHNINIADLRDAMDLIEDDTGEIVTNPVVTLDPEVVAIAETASITYAQAESIKKSISVHSDKIEAIKALRTVTGCSLKAAKDIVEMMPRFKPNL